MTTALENVINRFHIVGESGYSEFWRRNKSPVAALEMARLLMGLRKAASYIKGNIGEIVWSGMPSSSAISLDPSWVMGKYPIPAAKVDRMMGLTIRRAYQKTEWTHRFRDLAMARVNLPARYAYKFQIYFNMCENVYLDCLSNRSVMGRYTEIDRLMTIYSAQDIASHPPTISELLHIWWGIAADLSGVRYKEDYADRSVRGGSKYTNLEKFYKEPIQLLNSIMDQLIYECPKIQGVTERGNYRLDLYLSIWSRLFEKIKYWSTDSRDPFLLARKVGKNVVDFNPDAENKLSAVQIAAIEQVDKIIGRKNPVFTDQVKACVINGEDVVQVESNDIVMRARSRINKKLLHNLKIIIRTVAQRKTENNRGLSSGKMDRRRLYRAPTTGTIFQTSKDTFELVNDIILLVDATGSMSAPNRWEKAEEIYQTLFLAVKAYNPRARLFAYNEIKSKCLLTEIYRSGDFYSVLPHGKTASGEAIIATALSLKNRHKKPFIIHITDGASNWGSGVSNAIEMCRKNRIQLLTLGLGCSKDNKVLLGLEYGKLVQFVDSIDALPSLLRNLLNYSKWQ
ncbi:MAG: VWA domain-containing protein [Deltaproteobacteria bacterium]|nr:VWA domain-containing protein [Deltaproteobacteria bacterium]